MTARQHDRKTARQHDSMTARLHDKIKNETIKKKKMAKIENFEDLEIWKSARILTKKVYLDFNDNKDYGFKDQIQRCSVSVMNNIAEGFCRNGDKEFHQYLKVAKASCGELKSMYYLAEDIVYINIDTALERRLEANNLMNGIGKFMQYLRNSYKK